MRRAVRRLALLCLALPCLAPPGHAAGDAEEHRFTALMAGQLLGQETFRVEERGDTLVLAGKLSLQRPIPQDLFLETRLLLPDERFLSYRLVNSFGDSAFARVLPGDSVRLRRTATRGTSTLALSGRRALPLDNAVAQHLWLLARQRRRDPAGADTLLALVPQQLYAGEIVWRRTEAASGLVAGERIAVERHYLELAGLLEILETDAAGELLALRVPLQRFVISREDYIPEALAATPGSRCPEESVIVKGGGPPLGGTLTLPAAGETPWPACVLLHGSGPQDRDATLGPNKILQQLAQGLAARGVASLRYDKRTWVLNRQERRGREYGRDITLREEVLDDALAACRLLREDPRLDGERLVIVGHSLGAGAAPTVARELAEAGAPVAGLVLLAPPGRDLLTITLDQYGYLNARGMVSAEQLGTYQEQAQRYREGSVGEDDLILFARSRYWDSVVFWRPWEDYRAQPAPALILFGERDYQITAPDRPAWERALAESPRPGGELAVLPGLNHLFLRGEGEPGPTEYGLPGALAPELLDRIADWIKARRP
jgi:dienelactone hydrolase